VITCWPSLYRPREGRPAQDRAIVQRVKSPRAYASKDDVPRWAGAEFSAGYRLLAGFVRATWIVLDFDKGATREQIADAFGDVYGIGHTTWTAGRWRVGLVLSRPVDTVEEQARVWRAGAAHAERHGLEPDFAAKGAAHCFALPARHDGDAYDHLELAGAFFDVDAALEAIPRPQPTETQRREPSSDTYERRFDRARRYLEKMPGAISGSKGHATTFAAAVAMVRGFALEPNDALRLLVEIHNPTCAPAWSERELVHKVRQAYQRARLPFGAIADQRRERRSA
jgi:hypothetical protein